MAGINVSIDGTLTLQQAESGVGCPPPGADLVAFPLSLNAQGLTGISGSSGAEISQGCMSVSSPASFVSLAYPSNLEGRVLYLRATPGSGPFDVRVTHATAGAVTYPGQYVILMQVESADAITGVEVQGTGNFAWAVVGTLA